MPAKSQASQLFKFVKFAVLGMRHQLKVVWVIVQRVSIFMVAVLSFFNWPSNLLFENVTVFPNPSLSSLSCFYRVIRKFSAYFNSSTSNWFVVYRPSLGIWFPWSWTFGGKPRVSLKSCSIIYQGALKSTAAWTHSFFDWFEFHMPTISQAHVLCQA